MANLILTLSAADILKAVKSDTYITGQIDKSVDMVKNAALAYNEQAGDDAYHEVKLYRTMKGAVAKFEASMVEYVDPTVINGAVTDTLTSATTTTFTITIPVGSRFYAAFATTLSSLAQEYIINMMLYSWWQSIKPAFAKDYYQFSQESLEMVRKCLSKTAPATSLDSYTDVSGDVIDPELPSFNLEEEDYNQEFHGINESFYFTYNLGTVETDDIQAFSSDTAVATVSKNATNKRITITSTGAGTAKIILNSLAYPQITKYINVTVTL